MSYTRKIEGISKLPFREQKGFPPETSTHTVLHKQKKDKDAPPLRWIIRQYRLRRLPTNPCPHDTGMRATADIVQYLLAHNPSVGAETLEAVYGGANYQHTLCLWTRDKAAAVTQIAMP